MTITLKGITWNHSRGYLPMVATSQRFAERHPGVNIIWEKRSLQEFADMPLQGLTERYDLLVIDHPWAGFAAEQRVLLPLNEHLPESYLRDQAEHSVGASHGSYLFGTMQTALAIDAATPVASWRPDLLPADGVPQTWEQLMRLAGEGKVIIPAIPVDSLMNFYMLCVALGSEPFPDEERLVDDETGMQALELLRELAALCPQDIFRWNPIAVYEALTSEDRWLYCPFAYGYSNYSREGYARKRLKFGDLAAFRGSRLRSTLGGTGLAISSFCRHPEEALAYAEFVAGPDTQRTLYTENGGQPGHRGAWTDAEMNRRTLDYFRDTLPALDRAYLRPRYNGYLHFQDHAGDRVRDYMMQGGDARKALRAMTDIYRQSRTPGGKA